jgi:hypothetical protein
MRKSDFSNYTGLYGRGAGLGNAEAVLGGVDGSLHARHVGVEQRFELCSGLRILLRVLDEGEEFAGQLGTGEVAS